MCVCLCLGMFWAWLVGWLGFGLGSLRLRLGWVFKFPFNKLGQHPNTCVYYALCVLVFWYGLGMVGWMAGFGFGFIEVAVWFWF